MTIYIKSKKFFKSSHSQGLAILSILIVFSIICLGFVYLIQTNGLVEKSYQIREQKEYLKQLQANNQDMEMRISHNQSPSILEEKIGSLNMIGAGEITYLEKDAEMAVKE